jgi:hypothetical protein
MHKLTIIECIGIYGAAVGTLSGLWNIRQWLVDRAKLEVRGTFSLVHTDQEFWQIDVSAVNHGRRPLRIKRVAILLKNEPPFGIGPAAETSKLRPVASEMCLYDSGVKPAFELNPDGGDGNWRFQHKTRPNFLIKRKGVDSLGTAYVMLTSGKKYFCNFFIGNELLASEPATLASKPRLKVQTGLG